MSKPYKGFIQTIPLKGPRKVCRLHFFLVLPLKGFLLCFLVLATRKRVNNPYILFYLPIYLGDITAKEYISYERPYTEEEKNQAAETINENLKKNLLEKGVQILENHVKILDNESLCQIAIDIVAEEPVGERTSVEIPINQEQEETKESNERN